MRKITGLGLLLVSLLGTSSVGGCGPMLMATGAEVAASGMQGGTRNVAQGGKPGNAEVAAAVVGVGMMAAGYSLTDPDKRQPQPGPSNSASWTYYPQPTTPPPRRPGSLP